ncbi:DNA-packaging protein [Rhizobium sp. Root149]|uniref:head-tail connector protein n=1 Tax=Rhizobium sp. Root149 TaxID=1736473 RepID=UPI0007152A65|nr:head-tail connector protein [Rhizobium sp. Root149]KQZ50731.1 DNA-packaging protein [Rhizobium sp. Root149]
MIVTLTQLKQHLNITDDLGSADDDLIELKLTAAQSQVERMLGFKIAARYDGAGQEPTPDALKQAVLMLAAYWYENREAALIGVSGQDMPFGVGSIINEFREYTFG